MIKEFLNHLRIDGKSKNTIDSYASHLKKANEWKPLDRWTKNDVNKYILKIQQVKKSFDHDKLVLKIFFRFHGKDIAEHIIVKIHSDFVLEEKDILTIDEINTMIETTRSPMYKAFLAFAFESGGRISEILPITVDDIQETDRGMILSVYQTKDGKLTKRKGLFIFSAGYIRNYLNTTTKTKTDRVFDITKNTAYKAFLRIGVKAGIKKRVNPHAFRHAQATDMVRREYQETIIRKKLGWTLTSPMIAKYIHIVDDDVINATLQKSGLDFPKRPITNIKMAEPLKIADAAAQLVKINSDYENMKKELEERDAIRDAKEKEMEDKIKELTDDISIITDFDFKEMFGTDIKTILKTADNKIYISCKIFESIIGTLGVYNDSNRIYYR